MKKTKDIHIKLPVKMLEKIIILADKEKRSASRQIELLLEKSLMR